MVKKVKNDWIDEGGDETQRPFEFTPSASGAHAAQKGGPGGPSRPSEAVGPPVPPLEEDFQEPPATGLAASVELFQEPHRVLDAFTDGADRFYLRYGTSTRSGVFSLGELAANLKGVLGDLGRQGVFIVDHAATKALQVAATQPRTFRQALVAARPGWCGPHHYVLGDGDIIRVKGNTTEIVVTFSPDAKFSASGTHDEYVAALGPLVAGQRLFVFALDLSLAGAVLAILGPAYENGGVETVGGPGKGKTTLLMLAASAHSGRTGSPVGGAENWATTANALEPTMIAHSDGFLGLDEKGLAGEGKVAINLVSEAAFRLAQGTTKSRLGDKRASLSTRLVFLSTSNTPLRILLGPSDDRVAAIRQRLRTIDVSRAPHGCFQCLPETVSSYGDLSKMIKGAVNRHWGTVARAFLRQLVEDRARDEAALVKRIEGRVRRFKRRLLEDGFTLDDRTADFFGVIYATGRLARDYGALPKGWAKPVDTTLAAVRLLDIPASAEPLSVEFVKGQVERYARRHVRDILAAANVPEPLSGSEFRAAAGFWITEKGVELLVIPAARFRREFPQAQSIAQVMRDAGQARCEGGKKAKLTRKAPRKLCTDRGERAYSFIVDRSKRGRRSNAA